MADTTVVVTYFAALADRTGRRREDLTVDDATVGALRAAVGRRYGSEVEELARLSTVLSGDELVRDDAAPIGAAVDLLPPFAGG